MLDKKTIEERLIKLEQEVANLKHQVEKKPTSDKNWLDKIVGTISDQEAFLQVLEYGRAYRQSDRTTDEEINE